MNIHPLAALIPRMSQEEYDTLRDDIAAHGFIPIPLHGTVITSHDMQVSGLDMIVAGKARLQVKCDFYGGEKRFNPNCTGNLYLQVAELNPLKAY